VYVESYTTIQTLVSEAVEQMSAPVLRLSVKWFKVFFFSFLIRKTLTLKQSERGVGKLINVRNRCSFSRIKS